jgi:hypothetical protein
MTDGNNGGPLGGLQGYLDEIDLQDDELDRLRGAYMEECKGPREHIKEILTSVKEAGLNMVAFRVTLKEHRDLRRHERRVAELDLADKADYESMVTALGEFGATPLGGAALKRAKEKDVSSPWRA